jgi:hypothetical protein
MGRQQHQGCASLTLMGCGPRGGGSPSPSCPIQYSNTPSQSDRQAPRTFRLVLNSVNNKEGSPLMKMSAYCDDVGTCRTRRSPMTTRSRMKWWSISICYGTDVVTIYQCGTVKWSTKLLEELTQPCRLSDSVSHCAILSFSTGS